MSNVIFILLCCICFPLSILLFTIALHVHNDDFIINKNGHIEFREKHNK